MAADNQRGNHSFRIYIQCTNTFWSVKFVSGNSEHINPESLYVNRNFSCSLYGIYKEFCFFIFGFYDFRNLFNRINHAGFIVCKHDRNKGCVVIYCSFKLLKV